MNDVLLVSWAALKSSVEAKKLHSQLQWMVDDRGYLIYLFDGSFRLHTIIKKTDPLNSDQFDFEMHYRDLGNKVLQNKKSNETGILRVAIEKSDLPSTTKVSHDWCDPCTWYTNSVRVTDKVLVQDENDPHIFSSGDIWWIDLTHGRCTDENDVAAAYKVIVCYDGVPIVEGTDFTIDYPTGVVTLGEGFEVEGQIEGEVTATYSKATDSLFILEPATDKVLILEHAELNFCKDCFVTVPINFEVWVGNPSFNPKLPQSVSNPLRVLYKRKKYKNEKDLINAGNLGQGYIPKWGNLTGDVVIFPFNYITLQKLKSSQLAQLRLSLDPDSNGDPIPLAGTYSTASFYIMSENET